MRSGSTEACYRRRRSAKAAKDLTLSSLDSTRHRPPDIGRWRRTIAPFMRGGTKGVLLQVIAFVAVVLFVLFIAHNLTSNLDRLGVRTGFDFLTRPAGFAISQAPIPFDETATYFRAFLVALLNTLLVTGLSIVLATLIGFVIALARSSSNQLMAAAGATYVETFRNIPLLIQLLFWYFAVLQALPPPRESLEIANTIFLNNRGLFIPWVDASGLSFPHLAGFNFQGGLVILPELLALTLGLSIYSAAFIAEIMRGGIQATSRGQIDAAHSLGLTRWQTTRLVVVPLALRIIVPPLGAYYIVILKNSSLGSAIAYPELILIVAGTILNQTGQPIEAMTITLATYLALGLAIAAITTVVNRYLVR
jgi:general L-amino acid transport system permease protein